MKNRRRFVYEFCEGFLVQRMQQQFDFHRGDQLGLLRAIKFVDGEGVSSSAVKGILRAIDDYGRECFASIKTLADNANVSERVAKRAVSRLVALSLITREKKKNTYGVVTNHYRIVWSEVELFCTRVEAESSGGRPPVDAPVKPQDCQAPVSGTADHDQRTPVSNLTVGPQIQIEGPPDPSVGPFGYDRGAITAERGAISVRPWGHDGTQYERIAKEPPRTGACAPEAAAVVWSFDIRKRIESRLEQILDRPVLGLRVAMESGLSPPEVERLIDEFEANRNLFRSPGALLERIRTGEWPAAGVKSIDEIHAVAEATCNRKKMVDRERIRWQVCEDWKRTGKWKSASDQEIEAEIDMILYRNMPQN